MPQSNTAFMGLRTAKYSAPRHCRREGVVFEGAGEQAVLR